MDARPAVDEAPNIGVEATELFLNIDEFSRVVDRCQDLCSVADDTFILQQRFDLPPAVARDFFRIESRKGLAIGVALAQHGVPAQAGLRPFQGQEFENCPVIMHRHAPFPVMVFDIIRFGQIDPRTAIGVVALLRHFALPVNAELHPLLDVISGSLPLTVFFAHKSHGFYRVLFVFKTGGELHDNVMAIGRAGKGLGVLRFSELS